MAGTLPHASNPAWLTPNPVCSPLALFGVPSSRCPHVAANSPAEKAGWAVGDRIVAVNGHSIDANYTRGELWQVRSRPAGTLVKLTMASGDVRELRLADYY